MALCQFYKWYRLYKLKHFMCKINVLCIYTVLYFYDTSLQNISVSHFIPVRQLLHSGCCLITKKDNHRTATGGCSGLLEIATQYGLQIQSLYEPKIVTLKTCRLAEGGLLIKGLTLYSVRVPFGTHCHNFVSIGRISMDFCHKNQCLVKICSSRT